MSYFKSRSLNMISFKFGNKCSLGKLTGEAKTHTLHSITLTVFLVSTYSLNLVFVWLVRPLLRPNCLHMMPRGNIGWARVPLQNSRRRTAWILMYSVSSKLRSARHSKGSGSLAWGMGNIQSVTVGSSPNS